jgi:hypothetical protein
MKTVQEIQEMTFNEIIEAARKHLKLENRNYSLTELRNLLILKSVSKKKSSKYVGQLCADQIWQLM